MADSAHRSFGNSRRRSNDRHGFSRDSSPRNGRPRRDHGAHEDRVSRGPRRDGERPDFGERAGRGERRASGEGRRYGSGRPDGGRRDRRDSRPPQRNRVPEPALPTDVTAASLEPSARRELRGLGRLNAENVARHLVMVQRLLDTDPELAHQHARYAASHAGRIAVVREAAAIAAYLAGHYADALRDLRAARRLTGLDLHRAIEADCERALGHLGRALKAAEQADPHQLDDVEEAEIAMVVSSVRHEMGQTELGLVVIEEAIMMFHGDRETLRRLHSVRADRLEELGRTEEAAAVRARIGEGPEEPEPDVEVYDVEEESEVEADTEEEQIAVSSHDAEDAAHTAQAAESSTSTQDASETAAEAADDERDAEAASWSADFAARVQAEMDELLSDSHADDTNTDRTGTDED